MAWFVNFIVVFFQVLVMIVRALAPIVVGFIVFGIVHSIVWPIVAGAYLGWLMALMFSGALGIAAGTFLAGICWRL